MKPSFATLALLLAVASSAPVDVVPKDQSPASPLQKRDGEIIYLANCSIAVSCCVPTKNFSQAIYYPDGARSQDVNYIPENNNRCTVPPGDNFSWWEQAGGKTCTFPTGVTVQAYIDADAQNRADYSWAGWATNGFKNWNCYKDNKRFLFNPSIPEMSRSCRSIYYCLPQ